MISRGHHKHNSNEKINPNFSTATDSYKAPDVKELVMSYNIERVQYTKNKNRSTQSGDWWGESAPVEMASIEPQPNRKTPQKVLSNYGMSFGEEGHGKIDIAGPEWSLHRRKKNIQGAQETGRHFNILTGNESSDSSYGRYDPNRSARRISFDKLQRHQLQEEHGRYNIISNTQS